MKIMSIHGIAVNVEFLGSCSTDDLIALNRFVRPETSSAMSEEDALRALAVLDRLVAAEAEPRGEGRPAEALVAGGAVRLGATTASLLRGCGTTLLSFVRAATLSDRVPRQRRLAVEGSLRSVPTLSGTSFEMDTSHFHIEYKKIGPDAVPTQATSGQLPISKPCAVPPALAGNSPASSHPDYVRRVAFWLEHAVSWFASWGMPLAPRPPGYSLLIPVVIDGGALMRSVLGMVDPGSIRIFLFNGMGDDLLATVCVHEVFHVCQAVRPGLLTYPFPSPWRWGLVEGGAVLAEDLVNDGINRYIFDANASGGTLDEPGRSLTAVAGRYNLALFWKFAAEQMSSSGNTSDEAAVYRGFLQAAAQVVSTELLDGVVRSQSPPFRSLCAFRYVDGKRKEDLVSDETLLGNFWLALHLKDLPPSPGADLRFAFRENHEATKFLEIFDLAAVEATNIAQVLEAGLGTSPSNAPVCMAPVTVRSSQLQATSSLSLAADQRIGPFAAVYFKVAIAPNVTTFRVQCDLLWQSTIGLDPQPPPGVLVQLALVELVQNQFRVRDVVRSDRPSWGRTIANSEGGVQLSYVLVVVAATEQEITFNLSASPMADSPDVMITRWCSPARKSYPVDPTGNAWTFLSPDIWIDPPAVVWLDEDNQLRARVWNRGLADATQVSVEFWYQDSSLGLSTGWEPVRNLNGAIQGIGGLHVPAGGSQTVSVNWAPPRGQGSLPTALTVRVVVVAPGDPNADDKRAMTTFGNVAERVAFGGTTVARAGEPVVEAERLDVADEKDVFDLAVTRRSPGAGERPEQLVVLLRDDGWAVSDSDLTRANTRTPSDEEVRDGAMLDVLRLRPVLPTPPGDRPAPSVAARQARLAIPRTLPEALKGESLVTILRTQHDGDIIAGLTAVLPRRTPK